MNAAPLVSIITPAYNAERFLPATIRSVRAQTLGDWEWIVADDGSSDGTLELLRAAAGADPRISVVAGEHAGRPAVGRNRALAHARGRWIAWQDADDLWAPGHLSTMLKALDRSAKRWGFANVRVLGDDGELVGGVWFPRGWRPPAPLAPRLLGVEGIPILTTVVRRDLLAEVSPAGDLSRAFDEGELVEDLDLCLRLALVEEPVYVPKVLGGYRLHPGGISKAGDRELGRQLAVVEKWRRLGAAARLCRNAELLHRSKHAVHLLFRGSPGWREGFLGAAGKWPPTARDLYFAAMSLLPAPLARRAYLLGLGRLRRG
ncbi:MAG: glycosyltransferase [Candidatus Sumerlaeia bacterium]|nr:glycosyltransferase [Candidatus Sumerlaeia bacterium]